MQLQGRWILLFIGLLLLVLSFTTPLADETPGFIKETWQLGHVLMFYALVYSAFPLIVGRTKSASWLVVVILLSSLVLGLAIEFLQIYVGREFSLRDIVLDLLGALLAISVLTWQKKLPVSKKMAAFIMSGSALLGLYGISPFVLTVVDEIHMHRQFPRLCDFESPLEARRWKGNVSRVRFPGTNSANRVLKSEFKTTRYSGISLKSFVRDWTSYESLVFDAFVPHQQPLRLTIRIHDNKHYSRGHGNYHDRYNQQLELSPGWNQVRVSLEDVRNAPSGRQMDMHNISRIGIFTSGLAKTRLLYLDAFRLEI